MNRLVLAAIAFGGLLLRLVPLLRAGGPLNAPTDYDDAVYFSASALLFQGVVPYRDFVFVHPPGLALFLGLTSSLARGIDPAHAFAASRIVATLVGAANILLAGRIAMRAAGPAAGIAAAALYATYPDAVLAERGPYLEPVLNLFCLAMAYVWLVPGAPASRRLDRRRPGGETPPSQPAGRRRSLLAGVLCAAACSVKVLGGIWLIAALVTARDRKEALKFFAAATVTGLLIVAPFASREFFEQTVMFHALRPPDGILGKVERLKEIFVGGHLAVSILAVIGLCMFWRGRAERFFAVAAALTVAAFLTASSYWNAYNSHLAASTCVLAGIGASLIFRRIPLLAILVALPTLWPALRAARAQAPELLAVGRAIRDTVPPGDCVFAFDPAWTLAGGRLPPHGDGAPVIADSYGAMLLAAAKTGKFPDAGAAFQSPAAQPDALARLRACRFAVLGWRGGWQMSEPSRAWFRSHFVCLTPNAGDLCLWERWGESHLGLAVTEPGQAIEFKDGWFAEEGPAQTPWRWMGRRGVIELPTMIGPARLELALELPVANQTIAVAIDGRVIDRFTPKQSLETRRYNVDSGRELVLTTNHTFRPPNDARDLGVRLNRILWLAARGGAATSLPR
jgi:hypothetical protein